MRTIIHDRGTEVIDDDLFLYRTSASGISFILYLAQSSRIDQYQVLSKTLKIATSCAMQEAAWVPWLLAYDTEERQNFRELWYNVFTIRTCIQS